VQSLCPKHSSGHQAGSQRDIKPAVGGSAGQQPGRLPRSLYHPHLSSPSALHCIFTACVRSLCQRFCRGTRVQLCAPSHANPTAVVVVASLTCTLRRLRPSRPSPSDLILSCLVPSCLLPAPLT
jgi:hypothetical protein